MITSMHELRRCPKCGGEIVGDEEIFRLIELEHKCYEKFPEIHYTRFDGKMCSLLCAGHCFECDTE